MKYSGEETNRKKTRSTL